MLYKHPHFFCTTIDQQTKIKLEDENKTSSFMFKQAYLCLASLSDEK